jgi:hypothetical protein
MDPGSAAHHFVLRSIRGTSSGRAAFLEMNFVVFK